MALMPSTKISARKKPSRRRLTDRAPKIDTVMPIVG
jgi:hypothetical protein